MTQKLEGLASRYREILRHTVYLLGSIDSQGTLSTGLCSTVNVILDGALRVSSIAKNAGIKVPSASEQVCKLEAAGLVTRAADTYEARAVVVSITELGRSKLAEASARRNAAVAAALATLSIAERAAVENAVPAIAELNSALCVARLNLAFSRRSRWLSRFFE